MSTPTTLHLGLFFDGTGNHVANACNDDASNIAKLHALYPNRPGQRHLSLYIEGIGTRQDQADSLFAMATGRGALGWDARIGQARDGICRAVEGWLTDWQTQHPHQPIDCLQFDLFGFSRGAACARHLANDLCAGHEGLTAQALMAGARVQRNGPLTLRIGFMGLFDTVASVIGSAPQLQLRDGMARRIVHLVARDEHRYHFPLSSAGPWDVPVPGAHADVGGGYPPQMQERLLLTRPDSSHIPPGQPLDSAASYQRSVQRLQELQAAQPNLGFACQVSTWTTNHCSPGRGDRIESVQVHAAVEGHRQVDNDLSRVYLQIMHRLAVADGVALLALPDHPLPPPLSAIAAKLMSYVEARCVEGRSTGDNSAADSSSADNAAADSSKAGTSTHARSIDERITQQRSPDERSADDSLSDDQHALLYRQYIHHSSHWSVEGPGQTSDLEARFIHSPEPTAKRRTLLA